MDRADTILDTFHNSTCSRDVVYQRHLAETVGRTANGLHIPLHRLRFMSHITRKSLFSHRIMWVGFGIAASIAILNGFSFLYPTIPSLPIKRVGGWRGFGHLFTEKPWNAIGGISMSYYPFVIGLGLLMPLDLSFSSWFFLLFL